MERSERAIETLMAIETALDVINELCQGKRRWVMSIPARPDDDPDLIISRALLSARTALSEPEEE